MEVSKHMQAQLLYSQGKENQHALNRRLDEPQRKAGCLEERETYYQVFITKEVDYFSSAFASKIFQNVVIS
jgi:hypothetical protein